MGEFSPKNRSCAACIESPGMLIKDTHSWIHIRAMELESVVTTVNARGCRLVTISENFICILNAENKGTFYLFKKIEGFTCHHWNLLALYSERGGNIDF